MERDPLESWCNKPDKKKILQMLGVVGVWVVEGLKNGPLTTVSCGLNRRQRALKATLDKGRASGGRGIRTFSMGLRGTELGPSGWKLQGNQFQHQVNRLEDIVSLRFGVTYPCSDPEKLCDSGGISLLL